MSFSPKQSVQKRILVSLTALTLTAVLAGCSSDNEADLDTTETPDVETEYIPASADGPAQNVPEPKLPAVATENTEEGAEATLEYFWEAEEYASLTGETAALSLVSGQNCDFCDESIGGWKESYDEGSWSVLHGELEVAATDIQTAVDEASTRPVAHIYFELHEPATDFYASGGEQSDTSFETSSDSEWFSLLYFDGTAQQWEIEWVGLEDSVDWEE